MSYSKFIEAMTNFKGNEIADRESAKIIVKDIILCILSHSLLDINKEIIDYRYPKKVIFNKTFDGIGKNISKISLSSIVERFWVGDINFFSKNSSEPVEQIKFALSTDDLEKKGVLLFNQLTYTCSLTDLALFKDEFVKYTISCLYPLCVEIENKEFPMDLISIYKLLSEAKVKVIKSLASFSSKFLSAYESTFEKSLTIISSNELLYVNFINSEKDEFALTVSVLGNEEEEIIQITVHKTTTTFKNYFFFKKSIIERKEILQFKFNYHDSLDCESIEKTLDFSILNYDNLEDCINAISDGSYFIKEVNLFNISSNSLSTEEEKISRFRNFWK